MYASKKKKGSLTWRSGKFLVYPCCKKKKKWQSMLWSEHQRSWRTAFCWRQNVWYMHSIKYLGRNQEKRCVIQRRSVEDTLVDDKLPWIAQETDWDWFWEFYTSRYYANLDWKGQRGMRWSENSFEYKTMDAKDWADGISSS